MATYGVLAAQVALLVLQSCLSHLPSGLPHTPRHPIPGLHSALPWMSALQLLVLAAIATRVLRAVVRSLKRGATIFSESVLDEKAFQIIDEELSPRAADWPARAAQAFVALYIASRPLSFAWLQKEQVTSVFWGVVAWRFLSVLWRIIHMLCVEGLPRTDFGKRQELDDKSVRTLLGVGKVIYGVISFVVVAENVGLKIGSLVASAGVGGIALGLAAQQLLQDLLAALTMMLDKTLRPGDYVAVGDDISGVVVSRGWKSTRVRSPSGHVAVLSNHDVSNARIKTYSPVQDRRDVLELFVDIRTDLGKLRKIVGLLKAAVGDVQNEDVVFSACYLKKFEESRIVFELVVQFPETTLDQYRHALHEVNMTVADVFAANDIRFAVPYRKSA